MKHALAGNGVRLPGYAELATVDEALQAAKQSRYPSILKAKTSQSSCDVFKVDDELELRERFVHSLEESRDGDILFEDFVAGTEVRRKDSASRANVQCWRSQKKNVTR